MIMGLVITGIECALIGILRQDVIESYVNQDQILYESYVSNSHIGFDPDYEVIKNATRF